MNSENRLWDIGNVTINYFVLIFRKRRIDNTDNINCILFNNFFVDFHVVEYQIVSMSNKFVSFIKKTDNFVLLCGRTLLNELALYNTAVYCQYFHHMRLISYFCSIICKIIYDKLKYYKEYYDNNKEQQILLFGVYETTANCAYSIILIFFIEFLDFQLNY